MSDNDWRTPEHEVYEAKATREEETARWADTPVRPIPNLVEANHQAMDRALAAFKQSARDRYSPEAIDAERKRNLAAWNAMTPAEREAEALLCLAIRREMAGRERREATHYPEAGDVVHRLGADERHERREDVEPVNTGDAE
jgi:hypothetical protein